MQGFFIALHRFCCQVNRLIGRTVAWLAALMVITQFGVVLLRYIFGVGSIFMQESIIYMHALLFMLGAGFTLLQDGHVRVDIFYSTASKRFKGWVDLFGSLVLLMPLCVVIIYVPMPYAVQSWASLEGSRETSGIQAVYLLKSSIFLFAGLLLLQGIALACAASLRPFGVELLPENDDD